MFHACIWDSTMGPYPRSPRGGATGAGRLENRHNHISIHAPHEGERQAVFVNTGLEYPISIHAPHEGERLCRAAWCVSPPRYFNPRSPRGGATRALQGVSAHASHFNPRSPRGGATKSCRSMPTAQRISIHAPHEGERREAFERITGEK